VSDVAPIWRPALAAIEGSELTRYQHWLAAEHGTTFADYQALWEWSTTDLDGF
jgi:acetoacetyl-CoA synthetase